jgi:predicted DNA-binding transcriptional regulator YafY
MRSSRLVSILLLLQTRGRMTAEQLAAELEVSARTIYRDLDALGEAGVPIYVERGPGGGARLVEGYRTRLTGLNADEAEALFLSGLPGAAAELGLGTVLAAAQLKVMAALPADLRGRAVRIRERFFLDAPGWFQGERSDPDLPTLADAVWAERRVRFRYRRGDAVTERTVDPLGLVLKGGVWYLVARRDELLRTYRVSRIEGADIIDEPFERPAGFDLATYWGRSTEAFEQSLRQVAVTLRLAPGAEGLFSYAVGRDRAQAALRDAAAPDERGWRTLTVHLEHDEWAQDDLLRLGADAEILAPSELRQRVARAARSAAALYDPPGAPA